LWPFFIALAILILALAYYKPSIFSRLNQAWFNIGSILASVMNPLILGSIYFFIITPIAIVTKLFGRDELRIKKMDTPSYWITKNKADKNLDSMKNQF
jgi:large-conductance mechanosensitive channel